MDIHSGEGITQRQPVLKNIKEPHAIAVVAAFVLAKIYLVILFTINREFIVDEFSQAYKARLIGQFYDTYLPIKNVIYAYIYALPGNFTTTAVGVAEASRLMSLGMLIATLIAVYLCSVKLYSRHIYALFSIAAILSVSSFNEHAFRIRSETVAVMFAAFAFFFLLKSLDNQSRQWKYEFLSGFFLGLSFFSTQKAVYFAIAFGISTLLCSSDLLKNFRSCVAMGLGFALVFLLYVMYFGSSDPVLVVKTIFSQPLDVAFNADDYYADLSKYKTRSVYRNIASYTLIFGALVYGAIRWKEVAVAVRCTLISLVVMLLLINNHNQPWPYVFVMFMPLFGLVASFPLYQMSRKGILNEKWKNITPTIIIIITFIFSVGFSRNYVYLNNTNSHQKNLIEVAEKQLLKDETYLDGAGMLLSRNRTASHIGLDAMTMARLESDLSEGKTRYLVDLWAENPKIILLNYRTWNLISLMGGQVQQWYVWLHPNMLVAGKCSDGADMKFSNAWYGDYKIYTTEGMPYQGDHYVDGELMKGEFYLNLGTYEVAVASRSPYCILPSNLDWSDLKYPAEKPVYLFANMYE